MISRDQTYLYKNEEHKDVFDNSIVPHYGMHVHQPILRHLEIRNKRIHMKPESKKRTEFPCVHRCSKALQSCVFSAKDAIGA